MEDALNITDSNITNSNITDLISSYGEQIIQSINADATITKSNLETINARLKTLNIEYNDFIRDLLTQINKLSNENNSITQKYNIDANGELQNIKRKIDETIQGHNASFQENVNNIVENINTLYPIPKRKVVEDVMSQMVIAESGADDPIQTSNLKHGLYDGNQSNATENTPRRSSRFKANANNQSGGYTYEPNKKLNAASSILTRKYRSKFKPTYMSKSKSKSRSKFKHKFYY